ncbi:MAG: GDSL-type esterase/lipase family protein [Ilumatobacteraceae bacterium]
MATLRRGSARWAAAGVVLVTVFVAAVAGITSMEPARAAGAGIVSPAHATASATRGHQIRIGPAPNDASCRRVIVIGDSLTDNARWYLREALDRAGFVHLIDAQHSRRIPASVRAPFSGVIAAQQVRATWGEADCWVIALGSNDLIFGAGDPGVAAQLIESMLAATTPGARVWWVNLDYHRDPAFAFDFVGATSRFNATLAQRAATDPDLAVIDWYSLAEAHLEWFFDPVHVDAAGSRARAEQVADALPR